MSDLDRRSPARRVAGGRHNPSVAGIDPTAPRWLRVAAGWSWRLIILSAAVLLVFYATAKVQLLFIAVFLALVFTAVLHPLVEFFAKVMPRFLATALALILSILVLGGLITYITMSVVGQWPTLAEQFSEGIAGILKFLEDGPLPWTITSDDIDQWWQTALRWLQENSSAIAQNAANQLGSVAIVFMVLALATFCSVFFLARGKTMWVWFLNQLPQGVRQTWHTAGGIGWYTFSGFARGTVIIAFCNGILAAIILAVLGIPLVAPLAVLVFIGTFIPLIGAPAAMVIAMVVALAARGPLWAAFVGVGIALVGQLEGHVLQPLIMGKQVSLHPVVVGLVVTGGTLIAGILGAVVALPLVAVAWAVFAKLRTLDPPTDPDELEDFDPDEIAHLDEHARVASGQAETETEPQESDAS
ncbi:MAG: AI-2E family transporter [Actinomycetales bacterium]|nr:AI-2E family transporter [Actinomycetales bacterium]